MGGARARHAVAFAPAHVTGIVRPETGARDPRARGSRGIGIVLALGVTADATWSPGDRSLLSVRGEDGRRLRISEEVARRLRGSARGTLRVRLRHDVPIGQGFGTSAAGALATALAVAHLLRRPRARAIEIAHLADLYGGGGLGGVAAILGAGLEARTRPGLPPHGSVVRRRASGRVLVGVVGPPVPTSRLLGSARTLARLRREAARLLTLRGPPDLLELVRRSGRFTDRVGLASPRLRATLARLRASGLVAAQAMFGESFVAVAEREAAWAAGTRWLRSARICFFETTVGGRGAHVARLGPGSRGPVRRPGETAGARRATATL